MPRKSTAALAIVTPLSDAGRLRPRRELPEDVANVFREIVNSVPNDHFTRADAPAVEQYAFAILLGRESFKHLSDEGQVISGRTSPWVVCFEKAQRAVTALCMRLRLAPQARIRPETAGRKGS